MTLVDPEFNVVDRTMAVVLAVIGGDTPTTRIERGLYLTGDWSFDHRIGGEAAGWVVFGRDDYDLEKEIGAFEYGVCDSVEQFMTTYGAALHAEQAREFVVSFVRIRRDEQPPQGGWRWHKWGPYIGKKTLQHEYLFHEKDIDEVFTFHIYHRAVRAARAAGAPVKVDVQIIPHAPKRLQ